MEKEKSDICPFSNPLSGCAVEKFECDYPYNYEMCHFYKERMKTMENKTLEKTLDMAGAVAKVAANITEPKKEPKKEAPKPNNNANGQNVLVSIGDKKTPKPVEKHIHTFPENRALTTEECDLEREKTHLEYDLKKTEQQYIMKIQDRSWQHQMDIERKEEKRAKIRRIIGGLLVAVGAAGLGYSIYADYRDHKGAAGTPTALPQGNNAGTEGGAK